MIAAVCGFVTAVIWYALNQPFGIMPALPACAVCFVDHHGRLLDYACQRK